MNSKAGAIWLLILGICTVVFVFCSYIPSNTASYTYSSTHTGSSSTKVSFHARSERLTSLSSYLIVQVRPLSPLKSSTTFTINGTVRMLDSSLLPATSRDVSVEHDVECYGHTCDQILFYSDDQIDFDYLSVYVDVSNTLSVLTGCEITFTSQAWAISYIAYFGIAFLIVVVCATLIHVIPFHSAPETTVQNMTLYLSLALVLIDGPWLAYREFATGTFTKVFDLAPAVFHAFFVVYALKFLATKTTDLTTRILGSTYIQWIIAAALVLLGIGQFAITGYMPLSTASVYASESSFTIPFALLAALFHGAIIALLIWGLVSLPFMPIYVQLLHAFTLLVPEAISVLKLLIRYNVSVKHIGYSFATDILYILVANVIVVFYTCVNFPADGQASVELHEYINDPVSK